MFFKCLFTFGVILYNNNNTWVYFVYTRNSTPELQRYTIRDSSNS